MIAHDCATAPALGIVVQFRRRFCFPTNDWPALNNEGNWSHPAIWTMRHSSAILSRNGAVVHIWRASRILGCETGFTGLEALATVARFAMTNARIRQIPRVASIRAHPW